ncbi:MAG: HIT family protein [Alphaproteobacteria bacterium]|nr:HIT family protein [Alphaproteobacteria bacterium]
MTEFEKFRQKFRIPAFTIRAFRHWTWSLRPVHSTLGAGVISANRYEPHFSGMTAEECAELALVVKEVETRLKGAFGYDKINYLMLMMVDPHVHMHVIPRYASPRDFAGVTWTDEGWPKPPNSSAGPTLSDAQAEAMRKALT